MKEVKPEEYVISKFMTHEELVDFAKLYLKSLGCKIIKKEYTLNGYRHDLVGHMDEEDKNPYIIECGHLDARRMILYIERYGNHFIYFPFSNKNNGYVLKSPHLQQLKEIEQRLDELNKKDKEADDILEEIKVRENEQRKRENALIILNKFLQNTYWHGNTLVTNDKMGKEWELANAIDIILNADYSYLRVLYYMIKRLKKEEYIEEDFNEFLKFLGDFNYYPSFIKFRV